MRKIIIALLIAIPCLMTSCIKEEDVRRNGQKLG